MILTLQRTYLPEATPGRLYFGGSALATLERPWIANSLGPGGVLRESCVPDGEYRLISHDSARFTGVYALINEDLGVYYQQRPEGQSWGRTAILIHIANLVADVVGCIAVGTDHGTLSGQRAVLSSGKAMNALRRALGRDGQHTLQIVPLAGTREIA